MTSTRNKNTPNDYSIEKSAYVKRSSYILSPTSAYGPAHNHSIPDIGPMPSRMCANMLSSNPVDIENMLFGINSSNLVSPSSKITPILKPIQTSYFFNRPQVFMPKPLVIEHNQRPYFT